MLALLAACLLPSLAAQDRAPEVEASLVADVASVAPGATFHLGLHLELPAGWHVYWENPGDSGAPTTFAVEAPEGFELGPVRFPGPERFELAGDITCYGYERELLLQIEVRAPDDLALGEHVRFEASAGWLICKESCFLGRRALALELPAVAGDPARAEAELFGAWAERMPRPSPFGPFAAGERVARAAEPKASAAWTGNAERAVLEIEVADADELDFFPARDALAPTARSRPCAGGRTMSLAFAPDPIASDVPLAARGLLVVRRRDRLTYYDLSLRRSPPER